MNSQLHQFRTTLLPGGTLRNHHRSTMRFVALQIYPLRADMARMRQFINSYLNFVDDKYPSPFYFKPAMPYVMLQILYYPYLAVTTGNTVRLTQREVSFSVPLECYLIDENGNRVFNHYATCSPFLYLDVQPTITSGRDIFGLPKVALTFQPLEPFFRPEQPELLTDLRLRCSGPKGDEQKSFLKVFQDPPRFTSTRLVDDALSAIPSAASTWISMMTGMWEQTVQPPTRGYERTRDVASILQMGRAGVDLLYRSLPTFSWYRPALVHYESTADIRLAPMKIDMISLKQFRDAEDPDYACYQSLVSSSLYTDRINAAGTLGDPLSSDLSGGAFITISANQTQPVMDSFGLVAQTRMDTEAGTVWTLRPEMPFWLNADLSYSLGTNLSWRTKERSWSWTEILGHKTKEKTQYNTFGGGALQEVPQRLISPDTSIFILALPLAPEGKEKITRLCNEHFRNGAFTIDPCFPTFTQDGSEGSFVYMLVYDVLNSSEGAGIAKEHDVQIVVPFSWSWKSPPEPKEDAVIGYGVFPIYAFSDAEEATITQSEVFGRPTVLADIEGILLDAIASGGPKVATLQSRRQGSKSSKSAYPTLRANYVQPVLSVNTSIVGSLYSGAQPKNRKLIELVQVPDMDFTFGKSLREPLDRDDFPVIPWAALKQVVDCRLPTRASYQAIVMQGMKLRNVNLPELSDSTFAVRIGRYQAIPIVETLDLKVDRSDTGTDTTVDVINAAFAVWIRVDMQTEAALNACSRAGNSPWCYSTPAEIKQRGLDNHHLLSSLIAEVLVWLEEALSSIKRPYGDSWWPAFKKTFYADPKADNKKKGKAK